MSGTATLVDHERGLVVCERCVVAAGSYVIKRIVTIRV